MSELKSTKYRLFPSLLYHAPFLNQQECEMYVKSLETIKIESSSFNNDFYQTTDKLHLLNDMWKGLSDKVIKVIESIADDQCIMRDSFYTTGMWANIAAGAAKGYFHKTHTHPNSFFSAIIYLRGSKLLQLFFMILNLKQEYFLLLFQKKHVLIQKGLNFLL